MSNKLNRRCLKLYAPLSVLKALQIAMYLWFWIPWTGQWCFGGGAGQVRMC